MKKLMLLAFLFYFSNIQGQDTSSIHTDFTIVDTTAPSFSIDHITDFPKKTSNKKVYLVTAVNTVAVVGTSLWLFNNWYKQYNTTRFHFFNDNDEWLQMDKMGHVYSAYSISRLNMNMWRWAGLSRNRSIWIGGISGATYQTLIELYDGFSSGWGWSWGDFSSNIVGSGLLVGQEFLWNGQRLSLKFSFHKVNYPSRMLEDRADDIYGRTLSERMLKDYNGQTYWMSANLKSFFKESILPPWLNIAAGYGAGNMFGAREDSWKDGNGNTVVLSKDLKRYRQFYIAPDVDFTKIRTRSKILKTIFSMANCLKFPAPSIELSRGKLRWNWIHF